MRKENSKSIDQILADGLRRQEIGRNESRIEMTVLEYPSHARMAVKTGFITPHSEERPRVLCWYNFTDKGLAEARRLRIELGIKFGDKDAIEKLWEVACGRHPIVSQR